MVHPFRSSRVESLKQYTGAHDITWEKDKTISPAQCYGHGISCLQLLTKSMTGVEIHWIKYAVVLIISTFDSHFKKIATGALIWFASLTHSMPSMTDHISHHIQVCPSTNRHFVQGCKISGYEQFVIVLGHCRNHHFLCDHFPHGSITAELFMASNMWSVCEQSQHSECPRYGDVPFR